MAKKETKEKKQAETKKSGTEKLKEELKEVTETLQRVQADFDNYKKHVKKDNEKNCKTANIGLIRDLLPILDSFEMSLQHRDNKKEFVKGIEMIYAQVYELLEKLGLRKIGALGKKMDPYYHEVLMTEESDKDDIILEELQKGYMLNELVIRHTKVKISKKRKDGKNE